MRIRPLSNRILIKPNPAETETPSGIIVPDKDNDQPAKGEIMAVGPGARLKDGLFQAMELETGNVVLFGRHVGIPVKIEGEAFLIMTEADILGVVCL